MRTSAILPSQMQINCLTREDGWKPSDKTMKLLKPKKRNQRIIFEDVQGVKVQAERIVAESEDDSWLRLVEEEQ